MDKKYHVKKSYLYITIILVFSGIAMIAHSLRMMTQGLFHPTSYYPAPLPSTLDFWFDWFLLCILGCLVFTIAMKRWLKWLYTSKQPKQHQMKTSNNF